MKNSKLKIIVFFLVVFCLFFVISGALAVKFEPQVSIPGFRGGEVTGWTLAWYIKAIYDWAIRVVVVLAIVMIVVGGFQWMTAIGSAPIIGQAKARIGHALMGLILALGTYFILNFVNPDLVELKGLEITEITGGELVLQEDLFVIEGLYPMSKEITTPRWKDVFEEFKFFVQKTDFDFKKDEKGYIGVKLGLNLNITDYDRAKKLIKEMVDNIGLEIQVIPPELANPWARSPSLKKEITYKDKTKVAVMTESDFINPTDFLYDGYYTIQVYFPGFPETMKTTYVQIKGAGQLETCLKPDQSVDVQYNIDAAPAVKVSYYEISQKYKQATGNNLIKTGVSDSNACWPEQCMGNNWKDETCIHVQYSCHYGGRWSGCQGDSYAIDIALQDSSGTAVDIAKLKVAMAAYGDLCCLLGSDHIHISFGPLYNCGCDTNASLCSAANWSSE